MLINPFDIIKEDKNEDQEQAKARLRILDSHQSDIELIGDILSKPNQLGKLEQSKDKHFYSDGAFNLVQLLLYVLRQTGPAHVILSTYSVAEDSIATLRRYCDSGKILSIKFLIDNRVRTISPKPFDRLAGSFPNDYRCMALHAKVVLVWNDEWKISIVGSQNATHNPKLERGIIHTDSEIWKFDKTILEDAFNSGTT